LEVWGLSSVRLGTDFEIWLSAKALCRTFIMNQKALNSFVKSRSHLLLTAFIIYIYSLTAVSVYIADTPFHGSTFTKNSLLVALTLFASKAIYCLHVVHNTDPGYIAGENDESDGKRLLAQSPRAVEVELTSEEESKDLEDSASTKCQICGAIKPWNVHHCSTCKRCVEGLDHVSRVLCGE
jgi:hypothetical protein